MVPVPWNDATLISGLGVVSEQNKNNIFAPLDLSGDYILSLDQYNYNKIQLSLQDSQMCNKNYTFSKV
jgi:hypothetical protein